MAELPPIEVEQVFALDPQSADLGVLAVYKLRLPTFPSAEAMGLEQGPFLQVAVSTQIALKKELNSLLHERFPGLPVTTNVVGLRFGSLAFTAVIALITGATFQFFCNYENLRKGFLLFTDDLRQASRRINDSATVAFLKAIRRTQDPSIDPEKRPRAKPEEDDDS